MEDGLSEMEREAIDEMLYIGVENIPNLETALGLPWVRDDIQEVEQDALDQLSGIGYYDSQNLAVALSLPWVQDAISDVEQDALDQLSGIGYYDSQNLAATLSLPWVQDDIQEVERDALDQLSSIGYYDSQNLAATLSLPWVQDAISDVEHDALDSIAAVSRYDPEVAAAIIPMPFLRVPDATDVLALRSIHRLASKGALAALVEHPAFLDGIAEGETTLVAAVGTMSEHPDEISHMLDPGYATIESFSITTPLTPLIFVNIVGVGGASHPHAADAIADAGEFVERAMLLPMPIEHLILVLNDKAVSSGAAGTNYGFAFGFLPEYEQKQETFEGRFFLGGIVHEVAHYYWGGNNEGWINEGLANTIQHMHGIANGLSHGQLRTRRGDCEAHDLEMLSQWDPPTGSPEYSCNYYLGERLFLELRESMDDAEFSEQLRELYQLTLPVREAGGTPGIAEVRQVFDGQRSIVDKHWSGALNAPENRLFDEGVDRTSHDLVQWNQHPTYDGHSVTFRTLLAGAVLSKETIGQVRTGGYQNFTLSIADGQEYVGTILPPFTDGRRWKLNDPGDSVADTYSLDAAAKSFTITFPFPEVLGTPLDYLVIVWGFQDDSRTPRITSDVDILGYARIRVP